MKILWIIYSSLLMACRKASIATLTSTKLYLSEQYEAITYCSRRQLNQIAGNVAAIAFSLQTSPPARAGMDTTKERLRLVRDPATYSAIFYEPPQTTEKFPLLVVLHGAGINEKDAWSLTDPSGEHAGLIPTLLATNSAPISLSNNFCVVAPYSLGKRSFYEDPRSKILQFIEWVVSDEGTRNGCKNVDIDNIFLFGFSDGATIAVELATTLRFRACVIAAYGFTGTLPTLAVNRLSKVPMWIFHSADDVIFNVDNSDRLVQTLRAAQPKSHLVKYTRYDHDQEGFTGAVQGHSTGITASRQPELYEWLLSFTI